MVETWDSGDPDLRSRKDNWSTPSSRKKHDKTSFCNCIPMHIAHDCAHLLFEAFGKKICPLTGTCEDRWNGLSQPSKRDFWGEVENAMTVLLVARILGNVKSKRVGVVGSRKNGLRQSCGSKRSYQGVSSAIQIGKGFIRLERLATPK